MSEVVDRGTDRVAALGDCPAEKPWYVRCKGPLIIFAIVVAAIFLHWLYLRGTWGDDGVVGHDGMNVKVFDAPLLENCCSWWPISHFLLFLVVAYFFPDCWCYLIVLGALWELAEVVMGHLTAKKRQAIRKTCEADIEYSSNWWAGSFKDVLMNTLGVGVGVMLRKAVDRAAGETRDACGRIVPDPSKRGFTF